MLFLLPFRYLKKPINNAAFIAVKCVTYLKGLMCIPIFDKSKSRITIPKALMKPINKVILSKESSNVKHRISAEPRRKKGLNQRNILWDRKINAVRLNLINK